MKLLCKRLHELKCYLIIIQQVTRVRTPHIRDFSRYVQPATGKNIVIIHVSAGTHDRNGSRAATMRHPHGILWAIEINGVITQRGKLRCGGTLTHNFRIAQKVVEAGSASSLRSITQHWIFHTNGGKTWESSAESSLVDTLLRKYRRKELCFHLYFSKLFRCNGYRQGSYVTN